MGRGAASVAGGGWATAALRAPTRQPSPSTKTSAQRALASGGLTLVDVEDGRFSVALIPHTMSVTTLRTKTSKSVDRACREPGAEESLQIG